MFEGGVDAIRIVAVLFREPARRHQRRAQRAEGEFEREQLKAGAAASAVLLGTLSRGRRHRCRNSFVGRVFKAAASPVGTPWMWTLAFCQHDDRTPTHGYAETREAAMAAFAKSWRQGVVLRSGGRSAFGGKPEKHSLILSLTAFEPKRFAYRP
jgi:hypothetical protein